MMERAVYPQMNTLVRMWEQTLLSKTQKAELSRAAGMDSLMKNLAAVNFFKYAAPQTAQDLPHALEVEKQGWLVRAREITPDQNIADIFELSDVAHNLRVFIKTRVLGKNLSDLYIPTDIYNESTMNRLMGERYVPQSPMDESMKNAIERAIADFSMHKSLVRVDFIVKAFYHGELLRRADEIADPQISAFLAAYVDLDLLSVLIQQRRSGTRVVDPAIFKNRAGNHYSDLAGLFRATETEQDMLLQRSPYAPLWTSLVHDDAWQFFDAYADNYLLDICKKAKLESFGLFPLFAFLYVKLLDIKNVQIATAAKRAGATADEIAERLRGCYEL